MAIGSRIVERLTELHWERNDLMEKVDGLTPQALHNLIKRDSKRSEWDEAIAEAMGVTVLWLVYGKDTAYREGNVTVLTAAEKPAHGGLIAMRNTLAQREIAVLFFLPLASPPVDIR